MNAEEMREAAAKVANDAFWQSVQRTCETPGGEPHEHYQVACQDIEDAIRALPLPASPVPDGWRVLPVEPDDAMIDAGFEALRNGEEWGRMKSPSEIWEAMLAAAPAPPPQEGGKL